MTQTRAFWWSSRARRVDHDGDIVRLRTFGALFQQRSESRAFHLTARDEVLITDYAGFGIERDEVSYFRKLCANAENLLQLFVRIDEDKLGVGLYPTSSAEQIAYIINHSDADATRDDCADVADGPLGNVTHQNANRSAGL
jgi:hypothetical protein